MKNVTIALEEDAARRARVRAAEMDTSLSRLAGEILKNKTREETVYPGARRKYLFLGAPAWKRADQKYPSREKLHER